MIILVEDIPSTPYLSPCSVQACPSLEPSDHNLDPSYRLRPCATHTSPWVCIKRFTSQGFIHCSIYNGYYYVLIILFNSSSDKTLIDGRNQDGNTPLLLAINGNLFDSVVLLMDKGAGTILILVALSSV